MESTGKGVHHSCRLALDQVRHRLAEDKSIQSGYIGKVGDGVKAPMNEIYCCMPKTGSSELLGNIPKNPDSSSVTALEQNDILEPSRQEPSNRWNAALVGKVSCGKLSLKDDTNRIQCTEPGSRDRTSL